jgi:hypothetical protein
MYALSLLLDENEFKNLARLCDIQFFANSLYVGEMDFYPFLVEKG